MVTIKSHSRLTLVDVGIEITCDNLFLQSVPSGNSKSDRSFVPGDVSQPGDITVCISSMEAPPAAGDRILGSEGEFWQMYALGDGFLDYRLSERNPQEHFWWACIDNQFRKINIGVNLQAIPLAADGQRIMSGPDKFATDRKLMIPAMLNHRVLFFHGAGGVVQNKGFVIAGSSGSGKSTMAGLLDKAGHRMLSDECMAVREQSGEGWLAYGTPWYSSAGIARNESAPLVAILFLRQAETTSLHRLSRGESLKYTLQLCTIPWHLPAFAEEALSICERLISEIPMYVLNCSLNDQPVDVIERLAESL